MTVEKIEIDTLVVGAGQAGVAMSEHLSKQGVLIDEEVGYPQRLKEVLLLQVVYFLNTLEEEK